MRWKLLLILPFAIGIAINDTVEFIHILGAGDSPIVDGRIVSREEYRRWGGTPAGKLTIQIADTETIVVARTNRAAMSELPDEVRFQYTGDPDREVFIEGEEHPLWVALFLWAVSACIVVLCFGGTKSPDLVGDSHRD